MWLIAFNNDLLDATIAFTCGQLQEKLVSPKKRPHSHIIIDPKTTNSIESQLSAW